MNIIPNISLEEFKLRISTRNILDYLENVHNKNNLDFKLINPYVALYTIKNRFIEIAIHLKVCKVQRISYIGEDKSVNWNNIHIGMKVSEALKLEPRLFYYERNLILLVNEVPGIAFDISEYDPEPEDVPNSFITGISVYAEESLTPQGESGNW